ncbi:peroxin-16 [Pelomyxa schiedti]|nr:peroxin-16 [Pelomyxa schiedti]
MSDVNEGPVSATQQQRGDERSTSSPSSSSSSSTAGGVMERYSAFVVRNAKRVESVENFVSNYLYLMPRTLGLDTAIKAQSAITLVSLIRVYNRLILLKDGSPGDGIRSMNRGQHGAIVPGTVTTLTWSSVVECVELLAEMYSRKTWGMPAKWATVTIIEVLRTFLRLRLWLLGGGRTVTRHHLMQNFSVPSMHPKDQLSMWAPPVPHQRFVIDRLSPSVVAAELLYIFRPLISLAALYKWREHSWKPWLISLGVDLISVQLATSSTLSPEEKEEYTRRSWLWIQYLLRSPAYDTLGRVMNSSGVYDRLHDIPVVSFLTDLVRTCLKDTHKYYFNLASY